MERLAVTDFLTELPNRRGMDIELTREIARAERYGGTFALILFDLDHFKRINDHYGHQTGDTVLRAVAGRIRGALRAADLFGRWGGEEFLIIVSAANLSQAMQTAEKLRRALSDLPVEAVLHQVTGRFGVTVYEQGDEQESLLRRLDTALQRAKRRGRNRGVCRGAQPVGRGRRGDGAHRTRRPAARSPHVATPQATVLMSARSRKGG